jgi:hypothetical protein
VHLLHLSICRFSFGNIFLPVSLVFEQEAFYPTGDFLLAFTGEQRFVECIPTRPVLLLYNQPSTLYSLYVKRLTYLD